jgi:signal peptidase II
MPRGFFLTFSPVKKSLFILLSVLFVDQAVKLWIKTHMVLGESIQVAGHWFYITFVENYGMAFGMEFGGDFGKLFLSLFRVVVVGVMAYYLLKASREKKLHPGLQVSFSLIIAGAIGNIIDSAVYGLIFNDSFGQVASLFPAEGGYGTFLHGRVVDMFYFPLFEGHFPSWSPVYANEQFIFFSPVFNVADAAISVGAVVFLFYQKHFFAEKKNEETPAEA